MKKVIVTLAAVCSLFPAILFAQQHISVEVQVHASEAAAKEVRAVGFSVGKSSSGSLGRITTKMGPAGGLYEFGIRKTDGKNVACGKAKLMKDSTVKLMFDGKTCRIGKITAK